MGNVSDCVEPLRCLLREMLLLTEAVKYDNLSAHKAPSAVW